MFKCVVPTKHVRGRMSVDFVIKTSFSYITCCILKVNDKKGSGSTLLDNSSF